MSLLLGGVVASPMKIPYSLAMSSVMVLSVEAAEEETREEDGLRCGSAIRVL